MMRLNNRIISKFIATLAFFLCTDVQAMMAVDTELRTDRSFDAKLPLSLWPIKNSLTTHSEKYWYNLLWDSRKTLEDNRKQLVDQFVDTCCDFSFALQTPSLPKISVGKTISGDDIIFLKTGTVIRALPESTDVLMYDEKDKAKALKTDMSTNVILNVTPLNFTSSMKQNFEKLLTTLSEDSVGCEMMRVAISQYKGSSQSLPKITFIPVQDKNVNLVYISNSYAWKYLKRSRKIYASKYSQFCKDSKFVVFSPNWFTSEKPSLLLKISQATGIGDVSVSPGVVPKEGIFLHQMIYALQKETDNRYKQTRLISERTYPEYVSGYCRNLGNCMMSKIQINCSLFGDDQIYRTMYGFTPHGLDPINESAYLAHRYNFIRATYLGVDAKIRLGKVKLNQQDSLDFIKAFLETNGDRNLFWYYLSPRSPFQYPEFGQGHYLYSDAQPMTEE